MFYQFLRLIEKGGFQSQFDLARQMATSPGMVLQMARDLAQRGYLLDTSLLETSLQGACGEGETGAAQPSCSGCAASSACHVPFNLWSLTEKGKQAVQNHPAA